VSTRKSVVLPGEVTSSARAREFAVRALAETGLSEEATATAALITSELVANAVLHSRSGQGGKVRLAVVVTVGEYVQLEVRDDGPLPGRPALTAFPAELPPDGSESARGLFMVAAMAQTSGLDGRGLVWARVAWDGSAAPADDGALFPMPAGGAW
jgi:anti-sigma regulatory factor (Ser/Thr protein kinase)